MTAAISLKGVVKRFGKFTAVDHLDLEIPHGTTFGPRSPNVVPCGISRSRPSMAANLPKRFTTPRREIAAVMRVFLLARFREDNTSCAGTKFRGCGTSAAHAPRMQGLAPPAPFR